MLTPDSSPRLHLYGVINLLPADTVLAAIEVKSNLTTGNKGSLHDALKNCYKVKELSMVNKKESVVVGGNTILLSTIPYILFAYEGQSIKAVLKTIQNSIDSDNQTLKNTPDLIMVLKKGFYLVKNRSWSNIDAKADTAYTKVECKEEYSLLGIYEFLLALVEYWSNNVNHYQMPLKKYTEDLPQYIRYICRLEWLRYLKNSRLLKKSPC